MTQNTDVPQGPGVLLHRALQQADSSRRMRAVLDAGTHPHAEQLDVLVARCAVEPDFTVRDTLTWALTRHDQGDVLPRLEEQLETSGSQARSQALHTLSKIAAPDSWRLVTPAHRHDPDDEVAKAAWRAAVVLVPEGEAIALAEDLGAELGAREDAATQLSLSRALAGLGEPGRAVAERLAETDGAAAEHARVTLAIIEDPEIGFEAALWEARRRSALGREP